VVSPTELDFVAKLVGLLSFVIAAVFFAASQTVRGSWVTILGGGILVLGIEAYATYKRLYSDESR
jgi:hypothetical protein